MKLLGKREYTGSFVIFEDVFIPLIKENIFNQNNINRIFNYIEELSFNNDEYVKNIFM